MSDRREDILKRLRALAAMENDPSASENEVMNAAALRAKLIAKYNIELSELEDDEDGVFVDVTSVTGKYNETWRSECFTMAARMYMCNHFWRSRPWDKDARVEHNIVGEPHNVAVAVEMAQYFEACINRLANESVRGYKKGSLEHTERHRYIRTFRIAAAQRLRSRIDEYLNAAKKGDLPALEDGTKLPALLPLYERSMQLYEQWKEENGISPKGKESRDQQLSADGRAAGRAAGDRVSLNTQISEGSASASFALPSR